MLKSLSSYRGAAFDVVNLVAGSRSSALPLVSRFHGQNLRRMERGSSAPPSW